MQRDPVADGVAPGQSDDTQGVAESVESLLGDLEELADDVESPQALEEIRETKRLLALANERGLIGSGVRRLRPRDAAEAFIGSVIFASPLLVEDGVFDIAAHLFGYTLAGVPIFLIANTAFVVFMTYALLEWTGTEKEESHHLLGVVPARLVMVLAVSFLVAGVLMTVWGRVGWHQPVESIARINVLWTVGSLGAALGDIVSDGDAVDHDAAVSPGTDDGIGDFDRAPSDGVAISYEEETHAARDPVDRETTDNHRLHDGALVEALYEQFESLQALVDEHEDQHEVRRIKAETNQAAVDDMFGDRIRKYTSRDIAEAFVGSIFFSIPFLVEDGVYDVAAYFLSFRVGQFPVFFVVNAVFVLFMVWALVYWTGPQNVQVTRPLFGFIPRRLVGISVVSFLTAAALMTMWGRVGDWQDPVVAIARVSAVWTVASFGAALGDILPGESSGDDINDDLAEFGEQVGDFVDTTD